MPLKSIAVLLMLYGFADLMYAQPAAPRLVSVYADWYNGPNALAGVKCMAYIVPPTDSVHIVTNTFNGAIYAPNVPIDTSSSNSAGRVTVRVPLSSDLSPAGCRWRLVYEYRGGVLFDTQRLSTPNLSLTDTAMTCIQKATGAAATCP